MNENKINLSKVGVFSQQSEQSLYDFLQDWFFPQGIEIIELGESFKNREGLDLVI